MIMEPHGQANDTLRYGQALRGLPVGRNPAPENPIHPRASSWFSGAWTKNKGLTLIEAVVYISFLGVLSIFLVRFLIQVVDTYYLVQAEREVLSNARLLIETVKKTAAESREIYEPTSILNTDLGQLSLVTDVDPPLEHESSFADFWADNGRLWFKKDGSEPLPLSSPSVSVRTFLLERFAPKSGRETVRVTLEVEYARPRYTASATLHMSAALRGNY